MSHKIRLEACKKGRCDTCHSHWAWTKPKKLKLKCCMTHSSNYAKNSTLYLLSHQRLLQLPFPLNSAWLHILGASLPWAVSNSRICCYPKLYIAQVWIIICQTETMRVVGLSKYYICKLHKPPYSFVRKHQNPHDVVYVNQFLSFSFYSVMLLSYSCITYV